jgi:hypothetical protein
LLFSLLSSSFSFTIVVYLITMDGGPRKEKLARYRYRGVSVNDKANSERLRYSDEVMTLHVLAPGMPTEESRFTIEVDRNVWTMFHHTYGLERGDLAWVCEDLEIALQLQVRTGVDHNDQSRSFFDVNDDGSVSKCLYVSSIGSTNFFTIGDKPIFSK